MVLAEVETVRTLEEYPGNTTITEESSGDTNETWYAFNAPHHGATGFVEVPTFDDPDTARLYADVYFDVGSFREEKTGERGVPPKVAAAGTDTLYAYLLTRPGIDTEQLTSFFDLERETVYSYVSRVRNRAEDRRQTLENDS